MEKNKLVIFSKLVIFFILNNILSFGLKCKIIELILGFGKKQLGDMRNFFIIFNLYELIIEILDEYGNLIPGFRSKPISKNKTKLLVEWESDKKISMLKNKKVRFKFSLIDGDIYSFWVSPWLSGESRGSLPGGGPKINPSGWDTPIKND
ncbi:MAG: hypothetical protein CMQ54_03890 [Gammaproteobacteria bacterium]|nr:hypothetical protein [Gammaproteobacteria bacterium]